ncbi:nuclease-related domain-containing DEAD/DEAH box helicase [Aeromicrobium duanguangcaii]|uniref:NERD domain-containing protein n=1 Tax=Aeromicrobium duanguangcaii TaxID=2968086 RepID=A0ABY5KGD0_9ACTN|nr:NERD domain-containing protein [Aeromicrobium duanguangcaii]MCD9153370.1 NERD domain-containing protein [Aeromicrobium duanguangcaii]UUI69537.1 NERD domain-containing protein [Aeromicrobium duanguangcaii]
MPRLIPSAPQFTTASEQEVWTRLRDGLGPDDVLIANLRLTDETKDHEADLVVLMPDVGIVVVEVKGGSVWHDGDRWLISRNGRPTVIHPVDQVRGTKYAIRNYVGHDERWSRRNHVAWGHAVVTPYSAFDDEFDLPECPRWMLHDRDDQHDLVARLRDNAARQQHGKLPPTADEVDLIVEILTGRLTTRYDINADSDERAAAADRLTQEQSAILGVTRLLHRVEVRGGAGSGKTVLALQQAKQLTKGRSGQRPQRVAMLCYSLGLAEYLKREVQSWNRKERPAFVGTFHEFGRQWGAPDGDRTDSDFWERRLPALMSELADGLPQSKKYDAVIVDEAQDFADDWWQPVLKSLRDEHESGLFVYSDENQRIFARFGRPPVHLVPLVLDHNLRNTRQIHETFGPLAPSRMYARGGEGPGVRFLPAEAGDALAVADDAIDALLDEGWKAGNVCLLTTGRRHPIQVERTDFHDQSGYWETFFDDDDVFYGHVLGCKGLERRAVVLCVNESSVQERSRERLYVGMSRATDELIVVGDPEVIRDMGGPEVARRLGIE